MYTNPAPRRPWVTGRPDGTLGVLLILFGGLPVWLAAAAVERVTGLPPGVVWTSPVFVAGLLLSGLVVIAGWAVCTWWLFGTRRWWSIPVGLLFAWITVSDVVRYALYVARLARLG